MANIGTNKGGQMIADPKSKRFSAIRNEFIPTDIQFMITNINRRSKFQFDTDGFGLVCVNWLYQFMVNIEPEMKTQYGMILNLVIQSKLKPYTKNEQ